MNTILKTYARKYRFAHPTTKDFQKVVEQVTQKSWQTFFDQYVYSNQMTDFAVDQIRVVNQGSSEKPMYESIVTIAKVNGDFPKVPVQFTFTDGHTIQKIWNGDSERIDFKLRYRAPLAYAMVDPEYTLALENKHINNYLKAGMDEKSLYRWNLSVTKVVEMLLGSLSW